MVPMYCMLLSSKHMYSSFDVLPFYPEKSHKCQNSTKEVQWLSVANVIKYEFPEIPTNKWRGTLICCFMQLDRSSRNSYSQGFGNSDSGQLGTLILFGI